MLFGIHIFTTLCMTGLIWFVQVVHYPLFLKVGQDQFVDFAKSHQQRTLWLVLPMMTVELVTGLILMLRSETVDWYVSMGILGAIWLSTFLIQVPYHKKLLGGFDAILCRRLISSNWVRTILWTVRAFIFIRIF